MKKIYLPLLAVIAGAVSTLTGCIEETFPTSTVTQDQVTSSPNATASFALGMPAKMNEVFVLGDDALHYDWGYGSMMHIRDVMTGDMPVIASGYNWYTNWIVNKAQDEGKIFPQVIWNTYTQLVQAANLTIGSVNPESASDLQLYYLGAGYAFRALFYLDMARMFEYLPTDGTEASNSYGNNPTGLTVPIVTESMTESEARENPRAKHEDMMKFIIDDLTAAETYIVKSTRPSKTMPDLAVVYGLKARAYMWDENYQMAAEYARKAINEHGGAPTTKEQWLDTKTGFNTASTPSWMLCEQLVTEDDQVKTGIINWASWMSNEFKLGYSSAEPFVMIDRRLYESISNDDFRKLTFVAPEGSALAGKENFINRQALESVMVQGDAPVILTPYSSLKFKPGEGDMINSTVAATVAWPLMRVEEMYFIEAEAKAHTSVGDGKAAIENFMKTYRYSTYACAASSTDAVVDEIFLQKRMEFFGEGIILFDYKRLNKPVTRYYDGTNWPEDAQFNTTTRPAWMNYVIVQTEGNNNALVRQWNNPDPSQVYPSLGAQK